MATLATQEIDVDGLEPTYSAAAAGGDVGANDGSQFLHVVNGSGGEITVSVTAQNTTKFQRQLGTITIGDISVAVPAGEERMIGPIAPAIYNNASEQAEFEYSGVTSLTVAWLGFKKL